MSRFIAAIFMVIAPILGLLYFHVAKALLSFTEAARFLEKGGGIATHKLTIYYSCVLGATIFGIACALFVAIELAWKANEMS